MIEENKRIPKPRNILIGKSFGHWIVKEQDIEKSQETQQVCWKCVCDCGCGTEKTLTVNALRQVIVGGCINTVSSIEKVCIKCNENFYPKKQAKTRKLIKKWALQYKGNQCNYCGYNKCEEALEFHHINPEEKDFSISDRDIKLDWKAIQKELDKCILVCSNCHREIHNGILTIKESDE